jgi:hypothetical protein
MPKKLFIGLERPVAVEQARLERCVVGVADVPGQRVLAPGHEGCGATAFADRGHRGDRGPQIGDAVGRQVRRPGADAAQLAQDIRRIELALVDGVHEGRQFRRDESAHAFGQIAGLAGRGVCWFQRERCPRHGRITPRSRD